MEFLYFKQISRPSIIQTVNGDLYARVSKAFLTAAIPPSLSMLRYMFTKSSKTKIVLSGILFEFNSSIIWSKWLVSLILVSILLVSGAQTTSIKRDKISMAVLHPFIKRCTGLYDLWVLYSVLFFPGTAFSLTTYLAYSLLISFLDIHLMVQSFTLLMCNIVGSQSIFKKELLSICSLPFSQSVCLSIIMNPFPWSC